MPDSDRLPARRHSAGIDSRIGLAPGRILDIGFDSALVETHDWLSLGKRSTLQLAEPPLQIPACVVQCRLVRVHPENGRPVYHAALSFDTSPAVRQQLAGLVATLARDRIEAPLAYS